MDNLLSVIALLFALFLVLSAAVEAVIELFRGVLERFGITWLKGKTSLEDAIKLASEVSPDNAALSAKLDAILRTAEQVKEITEEKTMAIQQLKTDLTTATSQSLANNVAKSMNEVATAVKAALDDDERRRVFVLRLLSVTVGVIFTYFTDFHVFKILAADPNASALQGVLIGLQNDFFNVLVGGIAAAAGSNYWHDQLDRVRAAKSSIGQIRAIGTN